MKKRYEVFKLPLYVYAIDRVYVDGFEIKKLRLKIKMNKLNFANKAGISLYMLSYIEISKRTLPIHLVTKFENIFNQYLKRRKRRIK